MNKLIASLSAFSAMASSASCFASVATQPLYVAPVIDQTSSTDSSSVPSDTPSASRHLLIGPEVGVFFPTSGKTSDAYGSNWFSIGVGFGTAYQASQHGILSPFISILSNNANGNRVFLLPVGISYNKAVSNEATSLYYGIDALAIGADQRDVSAGVHSGFRFGAGVRPVLGYEFGRTAYLQVSYLEATQIKHFDFSGSEIEAGYRF